MIVRPFSRGHSSSRDKEMVYLYVGQSVEEQRRVYTSPLWFGSVSGAEGRAHKEMD